MPWFQLMALSEKEGIVQRKTWKDLQKAWRIVAQDHFKKWQSDGLVAKYNETIVGFCMVLLFFVLYLLRALKALNSSLKFRKCLILSCLSDRSNITAQLTWFRQRCHLWPPFERQTMYTPFPHRTEVQTYKAKSTDLCFLGSSDSVWGQICGGSSAETLQLQQRLSLSAHAAGEKIISHVRFGEVLGVSFSFIVSFRTKYLYRCCAWVASLSPNLPSNQPTCSRPAGCVLLTPRLTCSMVSTNPNKGRFFFFFFFYPWSEESKWAVSL